MKIRCKVCNARFQPAKEKMYIVREDSETGLSGAISKKEEKLYEAFDCPVCGCQKLVGVRLRQIGETLVVGEVDFAKDVVNC